MRKWNGFQHGINLGGWLSQCVHTKEHYDSYITKEDIAVIAGWGADHVRLPLDYNLIQTRDGELIESGFFYIDNCISWCREYGLNIILDLHKTAGYSFDEGEAESGFFQSEKLIQQFLALWTELAQRYGGHPDTIAFELLNEVVDEADNDPWMVIAQRAINVIRPYAPDTRILLGSYMNNNVRTVKYIIPPSDENIVYNFHCYDPLLFTHQGAYWIKDMPLDFRLSYPISKEQFNAEASRVLPDLRIEDAMLPADTFSALYFECLFADAIDAAEKNNAMLYCGEYGVIDRADLDSTLAWYKDIHSVFEKYGIGRAAWSYKMMDFGIADERMNSIREEIIKNI
ncbi:MAG: glycoside hydrolase family 5 protein [Wujia sp.]